MTPPKPVGLGIIAYIILLWQASFSYVGRTLVGMPQRIVHVVCWCSIGAIAHSGSGHKRGFSFRDTAKNYKIAIQSHLGHPRMPTKQVETFLGCWKTFPHPEKLFGMPKKNFRHPEKGLTWEVSNWLWEVIFWGKYDKFPDWGCHSSGGFMAKTRWVWGWTSPWMDWRALLNYYQCGLP